MDTSDGFFFSFDAPSEATATTDVPTTQASCAVASLTTLPPASRSTALFPWVALNDEIVSQWASAYCTATKPCQLELEVPKAALVTSSSSSTAASSTTLNDTLSFTLCYQTSPEVSALTSVTGPEAAASTEHRDVIPGRYYGGLKVWSCATLLAEYLSAHAAQYHPLFHKSGTVAELGCGQGLPGLAAICLGARRVAFQDYNEEVLAVCTKPNLAATVTANRATLSGLHGSHRGTPALQVQFVHGDWVDLKWESQDGTPTSSSSAEDAFCDVILGADVTFDKEACDKLACVLRRWLRPHTGEAIIASKDYYFGTNGGYLEFTRSAQSNGLQVTLLQRVDTADKMPHVVFRVTHGSR
ncbi:hypothetical protein ABB37_08815 [Leptomonas pyrrhocoris]|uniref:protein-histidine N-methyltransferase n=1 Tax=Leptomonas pyrrhocoris TaxID=157538 RepID=A0A0M9FSI9_LEPPY|nr:hypothetical protein ABB37_08815 [Leptomonas pyrrhocoris]KPA75153.1 hypothetical protein ABB37_08815 [Leptomonas pyrrhocoris]|eukprot:XP_015653592.1 hypothetical protein ABB37_08815 [Leptomonas pyrrhocoris]